MVSCTALTSNTPGRAGMITMVAFLMASSTTADKFGGVSMNTHSKPSRLAAATIPLTELTAVLIVRFVGAAQLVPECQRPLRIGIDKQTGLRGLMDMRSEMGGQGTLSRAAFTRCENNNVHTFASRLTPDGENESAR